MAEQENKEMTFIEHLEVLRWHIVRSVIAVVVVSVIAFLFKGVLFDTIIFGPSEPNFFTNRVLTHLGHSLDMPSLCINQGKIAFQNIMMSGQFATHIRVSFIAGLLGAFPYIFWEFWRFMQPALLQDEQKYSRGAMFFASTLFSIGILFAYYVICPLSINFLATYQVSDKVDNILNLGSYISTISSIVLAGGVIFELPILIYFLAKVGLISSSSLKKYRKHSIVASLLLAAIITPPDIISQILVCVPLVMLYEAGVVIAKRIEKKRAAEV